VQTAEAAVIKLDIINHVVNQTGLAKTKAERAVETVFEAIKEALTRGERIEFRGFGIFEVRPRKAGIARNPRRNIEVPIRPGKSIRFRPGKGLRDLE
jgi:DNA-binding protein HU-beta